ncbi:MAG: bacillithiol biosynthesis deacetylase BshB1 [Bacteroidota bacterium]
MKLDLLAFGAHPDDVELGAGGTVAKEVASGKKVGIIDLTRGELGSRGSADIRDQEAIESARILGVDLRLNLGLRDGFFLDNEVNQLEIVKWIRYFRPEVVICNVVNDRHPDHGKGSKLVSTACFLAGLRKIETVYEGIPQEEWRPKAVYHYIQDHYHEPDFVVNVEEFVDKKIAAVCAYKSQFYTLDQDQNEPQTLISTKAFMDFVHARGLSFGRPIHSKFGEGFLIERSIGVSSLFDLI